MMTRHVLLARPDVDERDLAGANTAHEFVVVDGLQCAARVEKLTRDLLDFGQPRLRQLPQVEKERAHLWVRQSIRDVQAGLLGVDETCASEHLQVVRGRGDALAGLSGERFDGPRALREEVEELEPARDSTWPGRCGRSARRPRLSVTSGAWRHWA